VGGLIDQLSAMPADDPAIVKTETAILLEMAKQLPVIKMFGTPKVVPVSNYFWDNFPTAKNYYEGPWWWWSNLKYKVAKLRSTSRRWSLEILV